MELPKEWPESVGELVSTAFEGGRIAAIRDALREVRSLPQAQQGRLFRLGICRTFTIDAQLEALTLGLATLPCRPTIMVGDMENIEQVLMDPESQILQAAPDALLVLWRLEELHPRLFFEHDGMSAEARELAVNDVVSRIENLCSVYRTVSVAPLFLSTLPEQMVGGPAVSDLFSAHAPRRAVLRINQVILDLAANYSHVHVFDFSGWAARLGNAAFDLKMDLYARQPIASHSLMSFAMALADAFRPLVSSPAKVLALDLDNVLWGGVLGEDGIDGIKIGYDFPGNVYRRIQLHALALKRRGVLLALLSKNDYADVERVFSALPGMPLNLKAFSALRVNWREKSENLKEIAEELNLGLDSFVFVDDQAFEREQMRFKLPQVRILQAAEDPLQTLNALICCRAFDVYRVSKEDIRRADDYVAQAQRRALETASCDQQNFLHSLQLRAIITRVTEGAISRVVQMLGKTNQFNVTTRRHLEVAVRGMLADPNNLLLLLSLSDRFGDQGVVGLGIVLGDPLLKLARVDSFLLSCRAIGRGAEEVLWARLVSHVSAMGYVALHAEYLRTERNRQVSNLFERFGMAKQHDSTEACSRYILNLPVQPLPPAWITVEDKT